MKNSVFISFLVCLFILYCGESRTLFAQKTTCKTPQIPTRNGLVYYYFWGENEDGGLIDTSFKTPFSLNRVILLDSLANKRPCSFEINELMHTISIISREIPPKNERSKTKQGRFINQGTDSIFTVIYVKRNGAWKSFTANRVLNFHVLGQQSFYRGSSNEIATKNHTISITYNSYRELYYFSNKEELDNKNPSFQHIFGYKGDELSPFLNGSCVNTAKRYLIFANGYRGPAYDKQESRNEVYANDRTNYWFKIDDRFIARLKPDTTLYIDGSFSVKTSNHHSKLRFGWSYLRGTSLASKKSRNYRVLNQKPNPDGFEYRYEKGRIAGLVFLNTSYNTPLKTSKDTLDFVCHSMGYAYMLGFIEAVQNQIVLGKMYIIAPENGTHKGMDWTAFQEVWQYGANLDQENPDVLVEQDGVAPQVAVKGLEEAKSATIGRIFPPKNWPNKHFIHSHMIYSYDWLFDRIYKGQPGYIR